MKKQREMINGAHVVVNYLENDRDIATFITWFANTPYDVAVDTETSGLNIYAPDHRLKLVQFGDELSAYVLDVQRFSDVIRDVLVLVDYRRFVFHNGAYDMQVLARHGLATLDTFKGRYHDTKILAHLLDSRGREDGGIGHGLKALAEVHVDPNAPDSAKELANVFRYELGVKVEDGWAVIPVEHPTYWRYAGLDTVLTSRLFEVLQPRVIKAGLADLYQFELDVQLLTSKMSHRGMRLDMEYVTQLDTDLVAEGSTMRAVAARYGVDNVNSTAQVATALEAMGEVLTDRTGSNKVKVDKAVLLPIADLSLQWKRLDVRTPNPLAEAVLRAKRAEKWRESYVRQFVNLRDSDDRLHPSIHSLQARTARMSVSSPPLQQLPSGDWKIRRAFVADEGMSMFSVDYAAVELRVVAALAGESRMLDAFRNGDDLHDMTAAAIFGADFTKAQRGLAKVTAFATVYGGGATGIARQTGQTVAATRPIVNKFHNTYPALGRYASQLQRDSGNGARPVVTPTGRQLLLDNDRTYAATNYVVQSTARDVMAQALLDLDTAGLSEYLLLPIHDEVVGQAPIADAADIANEVARVMQYDNFLGSGINLTTDSELFGSTWANGYGYLESGK